MTQTVINVVAAEHVGEFQLRLRFDDGSEQVVDFKPFLSRAQHPDIRAFLDPERFAAFRIEYGELVWGDYELCFPVIGCTGIASITAKQCRRRPEGKVRMLPVIACKRYPVQEISDSRRRKTGSSMPCLLSELRQRGVDVEGCGTGSKPLYLEIIGSVERGFRRPKLLQQGIVAAKFC